MFLFCASTQYYQVIQFNPIQYHGAIPKKVKRMGQSSLITNRYEIIQELGSGGFGDTYLAKDLHSPSQKLCVIKQLRRIDDDPRSYELVKERFNREALILESLGENYSHIPSLYAYFEEEGLFYLVQEYVEGETLTEIVLREGSQSATSTIKVLRQVLEILQYVHGQGIIHRDIKPDNILLRHKDQSAVLIDFGAIKEILNTQVTTKGSLKSSIIIGTPGFMSPEQGIGRPSFSSDLYSLGLVGIYLLTGKLPNDFIVNPANGELNWENDAPMIDPSLKNILTQAIASHPRDRFANAEAMFVALDNVEAPLLMPAQRKNYAASANTNANTFVVSQAKSQGMPGQPTHKSKNKLTYLSWLIGSGCAVFITGALLSQQEFLTSLFQSNERSTVDTTENTQAVDQTTENIPPASPKTEPLLGYKDSCGDSLSGKSVWYRVIGESSILETVKSNYCGDAFLREDNTAQIASFTSRESAQIFINKLAQEIDSKFWIQKKENLKAVDSYNVSSNQKNITGTYEVSYSSGENCTLKVLEQSEGNSIMFDLFCIRGAPSYNQGRATGSTSIRTIESVPVSSRIAVYSIDMFGQPCNIMMRFIDAKVLVTQDGEPGACGFGGAVYADGTYGRISTDKPNFEL